ncbi:MAG: hypothetical protein JWP50_3223 [Phenylobacterium sp.]|nr:hypothetical protein [Phenylobacterium sp.]
MGSSNRVGGTALACALLLGVGQARAADPEANLYVVNGVAGPLALTVDGAHVADLPGLTRITRPLKAGGHGLAVSAGGRTASVWDQLSLDTTGLDRRGRAYWCFLAGKGAAGALRLTQVDPAACSALVNEGQEPAAPAPGPTPSAAR